MVLHTKIFSEWLPSMKEYEFDAGYCVEYYDDPMKDENYYCEIRIQVKEK